MRIICEIGINHNGRLATAIDMIKSAVECGATDCKFQHIDPNHFAHDLVWKGWHMRKLFEQVRFNKDQLTVLKGECERRGVGFLCTPQTIGDFEDLLDIGIKEVKISSDNLGNKKLLTRVAETKLSAIMSIGMAEFDEIHEARDLLQSKHIRKPVTLMVCTSEYPCPPESVNLIRINCLEPITYCASSFDIHGFISPRNYGFSDHTRGYIAAVMAVALGATVFEKHFTLDHNQDGPDHSWSADPYEFTEYVNAIHTAEKMLGSGEIKPTEAEFELKQLLGV